MKQPTRGTGIGAFISKYELQIFFINSLLLLLFIYFIIFNWCLIFLSSTFDIAVVYIMVFIH